MTTMKHFWFGAFFLTLSSMSAAGERNEVMGLWASDGSIFEVLEIDGEFVGIIRVLKDPTYTKDEAPSREGELRKDDENPDPALRNRPIVGISMFSEYEYKNALWQGKIYDPETGNTYQSRMEVGSERKLKIRGYVGIPLFGRTATFSSVDACEPHIVEMLTRLGDARCDPVSE